MLNNRTRKRILSISIDVHLDDAVGHRVGDLLSGRARPTVEDQIERLVLAVLLAALVLDLFEDFRAQLDVTRLVRTVNVAEGQGRRVAALLAQPQSLNGLHRVINSGVQGVVNSAFNAVFFAALVSDGPDRLHVIVNAWIGAALATTAAVFFHEMGHAVTSLYDLPTLGKEEDAADQLSAVLLLTERDPELQTYALYYAKAFELLASMEDLSPGSFAADQVVGGTETDAVRTTPEAIDLQRTFAAMLAAWWVGRPYLPLDTAHPSGRLEAILADDVLLRRVVSRELAAVAEQFGTPRRTVLLEASGERVTSSAAVAATADDVSASGGGAKRRMLRAAASQAYDPAT